MILGPVEACWHIDHYQGPLRKVLDIGAYVSALSIEAARRGAQTVYAFEPNPETFEQLQRNILEARFGHIIEPLNVAVMTGEGSVMMNGHGPCFTAMIDVEGAEKQALPCVSFKDILRRGPVDYVKCDIEGAEFQTFDLSEELAECLQNVRFLEVEIHRIGQCPCHNYVATDDDGRREELIVWLQSVGFDDPPCGVRQIHPGAFCSFNRNFVGVK